MPHSFSSKILDIWLCLQMKHVQAHPEARSYRVKTIPSYPNLCFIFGKETSDGRYTRLAQAFDPSPAETVRMIGKLPFCIVFEIR